MENIINFKKDIKFDTMINEINEFNIDCDYQIKDYTINGNYKIFGTYKDSEIKIGSEAFSYTVPFEIELNNDVDLDTVTLDINDFDYQFNHNVLSVEINNHINYELIANDIFEVMDDEYRDLEDDNDDADIEIVNNQPSNTNQDDYVKYYVHIIKENETIDDIASIYGINKSTILEYNQEQLKVGSHVVIPNEE